MRTIVKLVLLLLVAAGCTTQNSAANSLIQSNTQDSEMAILELPDLQPAAIGNGALRVAATTSIVGDIVANVGGEYVDLVVLMAPGQDPHSFELSPGALASIVDAQVIFVNGWNLEQGLVSDLASAVGDAVIVPVSAGITPLPADQEKHVSGPAVELTEDHEIGPDPHVWMDPRLVETWVENIALVLSEMDPGHGESYQGNADIYLEDLRSLIDYMDLKIGAIPPGKRILVTGHDSLAYFAAAFDFNLAGALIPSASTLAEPSSSELARLIDVMKAEGVCTIFTDTTANNRLARTAAAELDTCDDVEVVGLYTGALGPPGSGAEEYLTMMRANIDAIAAGLGGG